MIWQPTSPTPEDFQVFTHIVDENGHNYAQADMPGLPAKQWSKGEFFASQLDFDLSNNLPDEGPLYLRFGMYDTISQARVLDSHIDANDNASMIQIRRWSHGLMAWHLQ
jgi:hypothetical protein